MPADGALRHNRELRRYQYGAFVLAAVALALGAVLLPRGEELLLIHVKNRDVGRARALLTDMSNRTAPTAASVVAHGELFLLEGRVDDALRETEAYAEDRPGDAAAWSRLARMYGDAQRLNDQIRALAHVYRLEPSPLLARQLATLYRWVGDEPAESAVLADLVASRHATAQEAVRSARLDASLGRPDRAYATLEQMRVATPTAFDYAALELYASLRLDLHGSDRLAVPVRLLPLAQERPEVVLQLARTLSSWGRPDAAVALFDTDASSEAPPARLAMRARVALGTREAERVRQELVAADAARPLPAEALAALVDLSLSLNDYGTVESLFANPARAVEPATVSAAIAHAIAHGARARAQAMIARVGDTALTESPLLALDLAVERGDTEAAERWIAYVDARLDATPDEVAALAQFETQLGLADRAFDRLAALVETGAAPEWVANDVGRLAIDVGRTDEALQLLPALGSPGRTAWARLALTDGRAALVEAWLMSASPDAALAQSLSEIYFLLTDRGDVFRGAIAAQRLFDVRGTQADALVLGQALLAANRPLDALVPLRRTDTATLEARVAYDAALFAAHQSGADVTAELGRVFRQHLDATTVPRDHRAMLVEGLWAAGERASLADEIVALASDNPERWLSQLVEASLVAGQTDRAIAIVRSHLASLGDDAGPDQIAPLTPRRIDGVRALMDLDAPDDVLLPQLRALAYAVGDGWVYAYDERLARGDRSAERLELWTTIGRESQRPDDRRAAASRLLDLGAPDRAAVVFEHLSEFSGPRDPDLVQLLSLWGPRPDEHAIAWLVERLQTAPPADRPAWITHLVHAGGARRVVEALPTLEAEASPALVDAWLDAREAVGESRVLQNGLEQVLARPDVHLQNLRHVGRAALAYELFGLAAEAFGRIVSEEPGDHESLRWLGAIAFFEGRTTDARVWLEAYDEAGGDAPDPLYQLGEIALGGRDADRARGYYIRALARLGEAADEAANRPLLANVLVRLDDRDRAIQTFEAVLDEHPELDHVRADFVVALLYWSDFDRARRVLDAAPRTADAGQGTREDGSGQRRIDLLWVQWLNAQGRYADALRVLDALAARQPSDPDVLVARASFDADRGRPVEADESYARAGGTAPAREDIERIVRERMLRRAPRAGFEAAGRTISGGWDERSQLVTAEGHLRPHAPVEVSVEHRHLTAASARRADGSFGPLDIDLSRYEAGATARLAAGTTLAGAVFGTGRGAGAGVTFAHDDLRGRTEAMAEISRPFWEFLETASDDGRRDRVGIQRHLRIRPDTAAWAVAGWNRYRLASGADAQSVALTLGVIRTVRRASPAITLQYGLDKEQRLSSTTATTADGQLFTPIPLVSREVHLLGAVARVTVPHVGEVESAGGYTIDRLGGSGSFASIRLTPPAGARAGVEVWGDHRLYSIFTSQRVLSAGARFTVRF